MTDFELLKAFLDGKQDFNFSAVECMGYKKIMVDNKTLIFSVEGRYLECIKNKREG